MDFESIFCIDSDFYNLEMGGFVGIDRLVPGARETTRLSDDTRAAWSSTDGDLDSAFGRGRRARR